MQDKKIYSLEQFYKDHLANIDGIKFTPQQINVIAYILSGWRYKAIASFLDVSPRTVETHKYDILEKLTKNSREDIIDFIQKSGKLSLVQQYYLELLNRNTFDKGLKKVLEILVDKKTPKCLIVYQKEDKFLVHQLEKDLAFVGIKIFLKIGENKESISISTENYDYVIYVGSQNTIPSLLGQKNILVLLGVFHRNNRKRTLAPGTPLLVRI